jgi:hypothetical protein
MLSAAKHLHLERQDNELEILRRFAPQNDSKGDL